MNARILVVEDEEALATLLRYNLDARGLRGRNRRAAAMMPTRGSRSACPTLSCSTGSLPGLSGIEGSGA